MYIFLQNVFPSNRLNTINNLTTQGSKKHQFPAFRRVPLCFAKQYIHQVSAVPNAMYSNTVCL